MEVEILKMEDTVIVIEESKIDLKETIQRNQAEEERVVKQFKMAPNETLLDVINYLPNRAMSLRQALDANGNNTCYIAAKALPFMEFLLKENKKLQQKKLEVLEQLVQKRNLLTEMCRDLEKEEAAQAKRAEKEEERRERHAAPMRRAADKAGLGGGLIIAAASGKDSGGAVTRASAKRDHPDKSTALADSGKKKKRRAI